MCPVQQVGSAGGAELVVMSGVSELIAADAKAKRSVRTVLCQWTCMLLSWFCQLISRKVRIEFRINAPCNPYKHLGFPNPVTQKNISASHISPGADTCMSLDL